MTEPNYLKLQSDVANVKLSKNDITTTKAKNSADTTLNCVFEKSTLSKDSTIEKKSSNKLDTGKDGLGFLSSTEESEAASQGQNTSKTDKAENTNNEKNSNNTNNANNDKSTTWNNYTVQNRESYRDLIIRSLKAQGVENPTAEQIEKAMEEFEAKNPGAVKTNRKGVKYLLVGAQVMVAGGLENKNNAAEQIRKWEEENGYSNSSSTSSKTSSGTAASGTKATGNSESAEEKGKTAQAEEQAVDESKLRATDQEGVYCDPKTLKHYKKVDGKWVLMTHNGAQVTQVNKDGSFCTRLYTKDGKYLWKSRYNADGVVVSKLKINRKTGTRIEYNEYKNGKYIKTMWYNNKNQCREVAYYDEQGRISHGKGYNDSKWKSFTTDYNKHIRTYVRADGTKFYSKVDELGYRLYWCDANGNKIEE